MFLRFCQIFSISSECAQSLLRVCSECAQSVFRVCSEYVQSVFRVCSECAQSVLRVCSECVQSVFRVCSECIQSVFRVCSECVVVLVVVGVVLVLDLVVVVVLEVVKVEKVVNRALDSDSFEGRYWVEVDGEMMLSSSDFTAGCKFSYSVVIASLSSILVVVLVVVLLDSFVLCGDVVITRFDIMGSVLMSLWDSGRLTVRLLDSRISLGGVMTSLFQVETETLPGITMKTKTMQDTALNTARRRDRKNEI